MKKGLTGIELVIQFLLLRQNQTIDYLVLEDELNKYNWSQYDLGKCKKFRIDSLQRYFRWIVAGELLESHGLEIVEVKGKYKTWLIQSKLNLF